MTWIFGDLKPRHYRLIYADPAWNFSSGPSRNPRNHYACMKLADIAALPVGELAHPDGARLCMWTTFPFMEQSLTAMRRWGFRYSTARVWVKLWSSHEGIEFQYGDLARGTGYEVIGNAEILIHAKVGRPLPASRKPFSVILANRREHSRKPDSVRDEYAAIYEGPRCELFARSLREGFDVWGNETTKFAEAA